MYTLEEFKSWIRENQNKECIKEVERKGSQWAAVFARMEQEKEDFVNCEGRYVWYLLNVINEWKAQVDRREKVEGSSLNMKIENLLRKNEELKQKLQAYLSQRQTFLCQEIQLIKEVLND